MLDVLLTEEQKKLRDEVRAFVRDDVPRQLILDMDAETDSLSPPVHRGGCPPPAAGPALPRGVRRPGAGLGR